MTRGQEEFENYYADSEGAWDRAGADEQRTWANVARIVDEEYPPGSDKRARLDAAAADAEGLLAEQGHGHLTEGD